MPRNEGENLLAKAELAKQCRVNSPLAEYPQHSETILGEKLKLQQHRIWTKHRLGDELPSGPGGTGHLRLESTKLGDSGACKKDDTY